MFQCDLCIFCMLTDWDLTWQLVQDDMLLCCFRRLNLDALWSRDPVMIYKNLLVNAVVVLPKQELFLPTDILGYAVVMTMLLKTLKASQYASYTQFYSVRKLHLAFSNMYNSSASGALSHLFIVWKFRTSLITKCPTQTECIKKFALGHLKRMGQVVKSNMTMTMEVALKLLQRLETEGRLMGGWSD